MEPKVYYWTVWWMPVLVFLVALVIFHVWLIYSRFRLGAEGWRRVDYVWLSMSVVSILGLVSQTRQAVYANYVPLAHDQITYRASDLEDDLGLGVRLNCDLVFVKSEASPKNFDEMIAEDKAYCTYLSDLKAKVTPALATEKEIAHDFSKDADYPLAYDFKDNRARIERHVKEYNATLRQFDEVKRTASRSDAELLFGLFAAPLLAAALALRMTKVTADIRMAEART